MLSCLSSSRIFRTLKNVLGQTDKQKKCSFWEVPQNLVFRVEVSLDAYFKWEYRLITGVFIRAGPNRWNFLHFHFYTFTTLSPKPIFFKFLECNPLSFCNNFWLMYHSIQSDDYNSFSFRVYIVVAFVHHLGVLRHYVDCRNINF